MTISKEKEENAFRLLEDSRWLWRTKKTLQEKVVMSDEEFDDFIQRNSNEVTKSTIPDPFNNELYGLKKRLNQQKA